MSTVIDEFHVREYAVLKLDSCPKNLIENIRLKEKNTM